MVSRPVPLTVMTDLALGGRWTSLRAGEREWLWTNPAVSPAERARVRPGVAFVDAGGGEECFPSVTGMPERGHDHGDVWCRPWVGEPADAAARTHDGLTLRRQLTEQAGVVRADYQITGPPGAPFLHAVHLLLEVSESARLHVPGTPRVRVLDHPEPGASIETVWPVAVGVPADRLGPDDGTATCAIVASTAVEILDGDHLLALRWGADPGTPTSFMLWRNLGGWPAATPYRSIGIEPMLGATGSLADAAPEETAIVPATGAIGWWLEIAAVSRSAVGPLEFAG